MIPSHLPNWEDGVTGLRMLPASPSFGFEYAANVSEAPQLAGARQEVRAYIPDHPHPLTRTRCVDYAVKIRVNPDQKGIDLSVKHSMVRNTLFHASLASHIFEEPF